MNMKISALNAKRMEQEFGDYVDPTPVLVSKKRMITIPKEVNGVERVRLENDIRNVFYEENKAVRLAQIYRDKCTKLESKCSELKKETQSVRYFWLNGVLEGRSRGARMLRKSLGLKF